MRQNLVGSITLEDVHEGINSGRFFIITFLFLTSFGVFTNALSSVSPVFSDHNEGLLGAWGGLAVGLAICVGTLIWTHFLLKRLRHRKMYGMARGLIVLARYGPEAVQAINFRDDRLQCLCVIDTDISRPNNQSIGQSGAHEMIDEAVGDVRNRVFQRIRDCDPNYVASEEGQRRTIEESELLFERVSLANRNQSELASAAVLRALLEFERRGVSRMETVIDVTDLPISTFIHIAREFGQDIQAFQSIGKTIGSEGMDKASRGEMVTDRDYDMGDATRFRIVQVRMDYFNPT